MIAITLLVLRETVASTREPPVLRMA